MSSKQILPNRPKHKSSRQRQSKDEREDDQVSEHWEKEGETKTKHQSCNSDRSDRHSSGGRHNNRDNHNKNNNSSSSGRGQGNPVTLKHCQQFMRRKRTPLYVKHEQTRTSDLPVMKYQHDVITNVQESSVVVITGETGCGKSTQIPHILLTSMVADANTSNTFNTSISSKTIPLGEIICTQPRRISATSLARRVSVEMGDVHPLDRKTSFVGYSIRGDSRRSSSTILTYCTTGILLRRLQSDPYLSTVSVVVVDEVHERTVQSDFLFIALRQLLSKRNDLKVLLMSATMDSKKISQYFGNAPVLHIPGRTFPVQVHYLEDIVQATAFTYAGGDEEDQYNNKKKQNTSGTIQLTRNTGRGGQVSYDANERSYGIEGAHAVPDESGLDVALYNEKTRTTVSKMYYESSRRMETLQYDIIVETLMYISNHKEYQHTNGAVLIFLSGVAEM